jgi:hypothetical protein
MPASHYMIERGLPTPPHHARWCHGSRTQFLDVLAVLTGCRLRLQALPDGHRPDVMRYDRERNRLFLGEAKETETPGNSETRIRLLTYLRWMRAYLSEPSRTAVLAICYGTTAHGKGWLEAIEFLSQELRLEVTQSGIKRFDGGLAVAWFTYGRAA